MSLVGQVLCNCCGVEPTELEELITTGQQEHQPSIKPQGQVCRAGSQVPAWLSPASPLRAMGSIRTSAAPTGLQELIGEAEAAAAG